MSADLKSYLNVLGFEATPWLRRDESSTSTENPVAHVEGPLNSPYLILGAEGGGLFEGPAAELLDKMLSAIGFARTQLRIGELANNANVAATRHGNETLILLFAPLRAERLGLSPSLCLETASPADCLRDPSLKRRAWDDLQIFARRAAQLPPF